jgi:hypothetical protein
VKKAWYLRRVVMFAALVQSGSTTTGYARSRVSSAVSSVKPRVLRRPERAALASEPVAYASVYLRGDSPLRRIPIGLTPMPERQPRAVLLLAVSLAASCGHRGGDASSTPPPQKVPPGCGTYDPARAKPAATGPITVVHVDPGLPPSTQLAVAACAGLHNRKTGGSVYLDAEPHDLGWLSELGLSGGVSVDAEPFLTSCIAAFPSCVRYDYAKQKALLPNVLTVAAALGAVPLDDGMKVSCAAPAFDAVAELADKSTPQLATKYVFDKYGAQTTGLAMLNPGYDQNPSEPRSPALNREMKPALVDFVFSEKLFVVFLVNGCTDGHPEKALLSSIVDAGPWPTPIGVYGYNNSWNVLGGFLYEAQTTCLDSHKMGAIASEAGNLSFFATRAPAITEAGAVVQNPAEVVTYDPQKTYVAFVVGDGDNVQYELTTRRDWFQRRVAECAASPNDCAPLTWSVSPHLARLAPDVLGWYYAKSHETKRDYFVLPPSGHLYAYPSSLAEDAQNRFVEATERDACVLGLTGTVHWDSVGTWHDAEDHFLPKYLKNAAVRGVFPVNVPFAFDAFPWWPEQQFFEVLDDGEGGRLALFKPREWRGVDSDSDVFRLDPEQMAAEIAAYPKGTVTWVYMTSDGGLTLENSFLALGKLLPPHVQLVSADTAASLAIASQAR